MEENQPEKNERSWLKILMIWLTMLLLLAAVGCAVAIPQIRHLDESAQNTLLPTETTQVQETTAETTEATLPEPTEPDYGTTGKIINVLLIGQDAREGEESKNADTMILVSVNRETKKITMISFLRDSLVYLENIVDSKGVTHSGRTKMTLCYALGYKWSGDLGAMQVIDSVIERNFGAKVDRNIEVNMDAFDACINAIGGVTIDLNEDEAKYLNKYFKDYEDRVYQPGENKLDGWAAEVYVRTRHSNNGDNDFNRTDRQRAVVGQVLEKVKNMDLVQLNRLIDQLLPMVLTDMSSADMANYAMELLPLLPEMTLESIQCPNEDMERRGKVIDLFHDGIDHSVLMFNEVKAKKIITKITEAD